jgi:hypothetical protein
VSCECEPVRRDSQDGGNPPGPGRFACVPCLSWLAGGWWMCSRPRKKKKRCCNVPLMRRPLARMARGQAMDRARGRWATRGVVACISPLVLSSPTSRAFAASPPLAPKTFASTPAFFIAAHLRPSKPAATTQAAVEFFQSPPSGQHGPGPSRGSRPPCRLTPSRSPPSAPPP